MDDDYEPALDSKVADIKQCSLEGDADRMLAARFLKYFVEHDTPWLLWTCLPAVARAGWAVWRAM